MIDLELASRDGQNLQTLLRTAIKERRIRSFEVARVKGGLKIRHKKRFGTIKLARQKGGILLAKLACNKRSDESRLLEAFVGRLAYHFRAEIETVTIRFKP